MKQIQSLLNSKKAQGALEFLMTYGWAFLVILIMIGALAYFGVLSPTKFLPERCTFGSQFICKDYLISTDGTTGNVTLKLQNNLGQAIYILDTSTVSSQEGFGGCTIDITNTTGDSIMALSATGGGSAISDGAYFEVRAVPCTSLGGMVAGSKYKINVNLVYYAATSSSSFSHTINGELFANVER